MLVDFGSGSGNFVFRRVAPRVLGWSFPKLRISRAPNSVAPGDLKQAWCFSRGTGDVGAGRM